MRNASAVPNKPVWMKKLSPAGLPFYYGWIHLILAAAAMVATLPGRSVGIGLITEPLLRDLQLSRVTFGEMNFWATLLGASFNLICGPAIDRFGVRTVATVVLFLLGLAVFSFSRVAAVGTLLLLLISMRGLGQSALSVVSLTMIGKWFVRRLSLAMGVFAVLVSIGFSIAIIMAENAVLANGWRSMWHSLSFWLFAAAMTSYIFVRRRPESVGLEPDTRESEVTGEPTIVAAENRASSGFSLRAALRIPAFYVFAIGSALYNLVIAGVLLFNQSILQELGFDETVFRNALAVFMLTGLAGNFIAGWLGQRWPGTRLMSFAMLFIAVYLSAFPFLLTPAQAMLHAGILGFSGGVVAVVFFTAFGKTFGRPQLGKIQGVAQVFTVFASATGPLFLATMHDRYASYAPAFYILAPVILLTALVAWFVPSPEPAQGDLRPESFST